MEAGQSNEAVQVTCVRRVALERKKQPMALEDIEGAPSLWLVKVTVGGGPLALSKVKHALDRLSRDRAFVVSVRFDDEHAEVRYWDECDDAEVAIRQALRLWGDDEVSTRLPGWRVVGLEVADRVTARRRWDLGEHPRVFALGEVIPFSDRD